MAPSGAEPNRAMIVVHTLVSHSLQIVPRILMRRRARVVSHCFLVLRGFMLIDLEIFASSLLPRREKYIRKVNIFIYVFLLFAVYFHLPNLLINQALHLCFANIHMKSI